VTFIASLNPSGAQPREVAQAVNQLIGLAQTNTGSVTSIGISCPSFLTVTGSPITSSGTIAIELLNQSANRVFAGPTSGGAAQPTFRALVAGDIPALTSGSSILYGNGSGGFSNVTVGTGLSFSGGTLSNSATAAVTLISTATPSGTGTVSFTSISGSYKHLKIIGVGRSSTSGAGSTVVKMQFNGDTGSNYAREVLFGNGNGSASKDLVTGQAQISPAEVPTDGAATDYPGSFEITIPLYSGTTFKKTAHSHYMNLNNTTTGSLFALVTTGTWDNTAAITQVDLILTSGNWKSGSTISLYGLS
jgi:hypothetical protein